MRDILSDQIKRSRLAAKMREILLDTETSGGSHRSGHEIIEIGLIEIEDAVPTGRVLHKFFRPSVAIEYGAFGVHGLSEEALAHCPPINEGIFEILSFIGSSKMVIHNGPFDLGFLNATLERLGRRPFSRDQVIDTVPLCRKATGGHGKLDAVVSHMRLSTPDRRIHTALLDTAILAGVYARLRGAPDVDIAALAAKADFSIARADVTDPKVIAKFRSSYFRRIALLDRERAKSPDAVLSETVAKDLVLVLRSALGEAVDFPDLMKRIEAGGVRLRPHLNDFGELAGFRFRKDGFFSLASDLGMRVSDLQRGNKAYVQKDHMQLVREMQMAYDVSFGNTKMDEARQLSPAFFAKNKVTIDVVSEPVKPGEAERVSQAVLDINGTTPRVDAQHYRPLVVGRDQWSSASYDWILKNSTPAYEAIPEVKEAFDQMAVASRMTALRWVCRGLDPVHAVTMSVARDLHFRNPVSDDVRAIAERLADRRGDRPEL